jgi:hypothetical protein
VIIASPSQRQVRPPVIVAIPARNEADRIAACLNALDGQTTSPDAVIVLFNNSTDDGETIVRDMRPGFDLRVVAVDLPPETAGAGPARRLAMEHAAQLAGPGGILMTTDADGMVSPEWVQRNVAGLLAGADVVCGRAIIDPAEAALIPRHLHDDDALEQRLSGLLDEMASVVDPDLADPLPRHTEASGASLAVWVSAWRRAGGIPPILTAEDRGFIAALRWLDARIRHDRAAAGMAEAIRRRTVQQDEFIDDALEPAVDALRRLTLVARSRAVWATQWPDPSLADELGVAPDDLRKALSRPFFGAAWAVLQGKSVLAQRRRVRFADLPHEIATAEALLAQLAVRSDSRAAA